MTLSRPSDPMLCMRNTSLVGKAPVFSVGPCVPCTSYRPRTAKDFARCSGSRRLGMRFPGRLLREVPKRDERTLVTILTSSPHPTCRGSPRQSCKVPFKRGSVRFQISKSVLHICGIARFMGGRRRSSTSYKGWPFSSVSMEGTYGVNICSVRCWASFVLMR